MTRQVHFLLPGRPETRTGGYIYDARMVRALREAGTRVEVLAPEADPPDTAALAGFADAALAGLAADSLVVVDGLALGRLPGVAERHAGRLRLVALVHHPLALETGLDAAARAALFESERAALSRVRGVITTSARTKRDLAPYGVAPERLWVARPGVDRAEVARGGDVDGVAMLCVASLTPRKGHLDLLRALADLPDRAWTLRCVGGLHFDPAHAGRVDDAIAEWGLEDAVTLAGELDGSELAEAYDAADLFVLASHHEGYGMALSEALARGLPIVAAAAGAVPEAVPEAAGLLVPPGDVAALRRALARVLDDETLLDELRAGALDAREDLVGWDEAADRFAAALAALGDG